MTYGYCFHLKLPVFVFEMTVGCVGYDRAIFEEDDKRANSNVHKIPLQGVWMEVSRLRITQIADGGVTDMTFRRNPWHV